MTMTVEELLDQARQLPREERMRLAAALIEPADTPLAQRLQALRARIVADQAPLLAWEALEREITERRGGQV